MFVGAIKRIIKRIPRLQKFVRTVCPPPLNAIWRGYSTWRDPVLLPTQTAIESQSPPNDLRQFFDTHKQGRGIWKWNHYFDIYERHFSRFRGTEVHILEIGIYSGGSLEMWKDYFGSRAQIYGVDIVPACRVYEGPSVKVFIGDQGDRSFWRRFKEEVPHIDIVIDDGSHIGELQIVSFEELLPHMRAGGIYLCEDLNRLNRFASYIYGFANNLNTTTSEAADQNSDNSERSIVVRATALQSAVRSVHLYPFVTVVEKTDTAIEEFVAAKHGTQWEPWIY